MYYYSTVNGIIMTHSALLEKDGFDIVKVHFERPNDDGFDFLDMTLPGEIVYKSFGFSEDEILKLKRFPTNFRSLSTGSTIARLKSFQSVPAFKFRRLRNFNRMCIGYAFKPHLSSRLTLSGRTFLRKP